MFKQAILVIFLSLLYCIAVRAQENPIAWKEGGLLYWGEIDGKIIGNDGGGEFWISADSNISWTSLSAGLWRDGTMMFNYWTQIQNNCFIQYNPTDAPFPGEEHLGRGFYLFLNQTLEWKYILLPKEPYDSVRLISIGTISSDTMIALFKVGSKSILYRTFDQGNNWSAITDNLSDECYIKEMVLFDHDNLVVNIYTYNRQGVPDGPSLFKSTDLGDTWNITGSDLPDSCSITIFANDGLGNVLCRLHGTIDGKDVKYAHYITNDGFHSFRAFPTVFPTDTDTLYSFTEIYLLENMMFLTVETYDTLGNVGYKILYSLDSGKLWKYVLDPDAVVTGFPRVVPFQNGYIVASDGYYLLENLDSVGAKIRFGTIADGQDKKITIVSGNNILLARAHDTYIQTTNYTSISQDDGISWKIRQNESVRLATSKWHVSNDIIYAPGVKDSHACVFTSTDNGDSWLPLPYIAKGVEAHWVQVSHDTIVAMLSSKQVYVSVDNGTSWREVTYMSSPFLASIEPIYANGKVFCISQDRRGIVRYSFASDLWNVVTMPDTLPTYGQYSGGAYCDGKLYMFTNYYGYDASSLPLPIVYRSSDIGETWDIFDTGLPDTAYLSSYTINNNTLYALITDMKKGAESDINLYYLGKGNDTWQSTSINSYLLSEVYASDSYVYLKNDRGLYRYPVSIVSVPITEDISTNTFDIYPNPASTSITFRQGEFRAVSYVCTDITGKMYQFGELRNASNEISIDIRTLPNGSYTLRLQNQSGEVESRRFVVVK